MGLYINGKLVGISLPQRNSGGDEITVINNTGSAITNGDKVWVETESKNFTIVGSPTIANKVASNFSDANYLQVSQMANTTSGTWTFDVEFTYVTNPYPPHANLPQPIVYFTDSDNNNRGVFVVEGLIQGTIPSTNSDGYESFNSSIALTSGETYHLQIELTANSSKIYIKHNGSIIETLSGQNGTYMPASITGFILGADGWYDEYFAGSINLNNTNIKINNSTAWSPYSPAQPYYLINFTDVSSSTITGIAKENIAVSGTGDVDIGTIITPTKKYNLLDRVKDDNNNEIGTVSGFFTDANNVEYAVVCLDAQYRNYDNTITWCDNYGVVTNLPAYQDWDLWESKETATFNTQKILDYCSANNYTSGACSHCRTQSFTIDGTTYYGQLPNIIELSDIERNYTALNTADPTSSMYGGMVSLGSSFGFWSSNQFDTQMCFNAEGAGQITVVPKNIYMIVAPVLEIPNT